MTRFPFADAMTSSDGAPAGAPMTADSLRVTLVDARAARLVSSLTAMMGVYQGNEGAQAIVGNLREDAESLFAEIVRLRAAIAKAKGGAG